MVLHHFPTLHGRRSISWSLDPELKNCLSKTIETPTKGKEQQIGPRKRIKSKLSPRVSSKLLLRPNEFLVSANVPGIFKMGHCESTTFAKFQRQICIYGEWWSKSMRQREFHFLPVEGTGLFGVGSEKNLIFENSPLHRLCPLYLRLPSFFLLLDKHYVVCSLETRTFSVLHLVRVVPVGMVANGGGPLLLQISREWLLKWKTLYSIVEHLELF